MKKTGINLKKFDRFFSQVAGKRNSPALRACYNQWGVRYLAETKRSFVRNSAGGGEWPPLKSKRKRGDTKSGRILRDTGTLFKALSVGSPGNLYLDLKRGKRVGFGGPTRHPSGQLTIADIAKAHHNGRGNLPKRVILHKPSGKLVIQMLGDLSRAINKIGRGV
jgi:hypothetical protein